MPLPPDIAVDLSPQSFSGDGVTIQPLADGGLDVMLDNGAGTSAAPALGGEGGEFDANLAEQMDESALGAIAQTILEWVDADEQSRKGWWDRLEAGLVKVGLVDNKDGEDHDASIKGASRVIHPLIVEAAVQFQARALEELVPSAGPVKATVIGQSTPQLQEQADRVADYMNYQVVHKDDSYFWDVDQMLFYLPFGGSAFKKTYPDPLRKMVMSRFIKAGDILVPYGAQRGSEPRITHRIRMPHNELLKLQRTGFYREEVIQASDDQGEPGLADRADDAEPSSGTILEGDHTLFECHCDYELPAIDQSGDYEGIAWPYVITVDRETQKVLAIRRNWREQDEARAVRRWFTQYRYLPGFGYYGFGLLHVIGGLQDAATGALRAALDGASAANFQGGFKSKDVSIKGGEIVLEHGKWKDVDATAEELSKAFYTPPFKEPSTGLFQVLGIITEAGQRFASTTEAMVGEGANNVPVGTTVARIEQGSKVYTGIHRRLHKSAGEEFKLRAALNAEHVPEQGYPYASGGKSRQIFQADFDDRVDVEPVSDPNIFSSTQRIAIAQAQLQLAQSAPGMYDMYEAHRSMLRALRSPDIDTILIDPSKIESCDPVSEGQLVLTGKPIRAFPEQAHEAHIAIHMAQMQMFQGTPMAQQILPVMMAHLAEHFAMLYRLQAMQMIGMPLPDATQAERQKLPMELENMIAVKTAQALAQMQAQMQAQQAAAPNPEAQAMEADSKRKDAATEADIRRKDAVAKADLDRKARADQMEQAGAEEERRIADADAFIKQAGAKGIEPRLLAQAAQETGLDLQATLDLIMRVRAGGQRQGQPLPKIEGGR